MTPTIDQAIDIIRQIPPPDREKVRNWIDEENQKELTEAKKNELERKNQKFKRALQWIEKTRKNTTENSSCSKAII